MTQERKRASWTPGMVGLALSLVPMIYLHVTSSAALSPIDDVISDYVFVPDGATLLALSSLTLAAASVALLRFLIARGLPSRGPETWLVGLWVAGLVLVALFPTDPTDTPTTFSGIVHRYAGAVMFTSLPIAGLLIARRFLDSPVVHRFSIAAGLAAIAFMLTHVTMFQQGTGTALVGLAERVLFVLLYGLLFAIAVAAANRAATR